MSLILRPYQQEAVEALFGYWEKNTKPCIIQAPTAFGKSIVIAEIVKRLNAPTLILQPSKEILEQNYEKLLLAGVPASMIKICSASVGSHEVGLITLATIGTIRNQIELCNHFVAVVIDENDVVPVDNINSMYLKFFNSLRRQPLIIGVTASPFRNQTFTARYEAPKVYCRPLTRIHCKGGKRGVGFGEWFWSGGIIYRCGISDLQAQGYLTPTQYHQAWTDWSFVEDRPGRAEYEMGQMTKWVENDQNLSRFHQGITWCMERNLKTIVFTPNIDMNFRLMNTIRGLGGTAECMDSDHDTKESRECKMADFRAGKFQFLVNVGMVGRGVDVPSVDCVMLCRPTKSLAVYLQAIGRSLRLDPNNPDKIAYILDLAGCVERFGLVEDIEITQIDAVTATGWKYKKDVIRIVKDGKPKIWERVS